MHNRVACAFIIIITDHVCPSVYPFSHASYYAVNCMQNARHYRKTVQQWNVCCVGGETVKVSLQSFLWGVHHLQSHTQYNVTTGQELYINITATGRTVDD